MNRGGRKVLVIGGGVIGISCAYFLSKQGWEVTVIDRGGIGQACSQANCGLICPSHVLPLAEPGAVRQAIRSLFSRNAAFRVKPRLDPALWGWLWTFARRCNQQDMLTAGHAIQPLLESSLELYHQLMENEPLSCEWETRGLLYVFQKLKPMEAYAETNHLLSEHFQVAARRLDCEELLQLEPALKQGLAGGWYYDHDAHLRPNKLLTSWINLLQARGVSFRENCSMQEFSGANGHARFVKTAQEELAADAFVVATGSWTPSFAKQLGSRIPIQPGKGYSITMPRPKVCPTIPLLLPEHRVAVTPFQSGYRLGSIMEFAGYDTSIHRRRLDLLRDGAVHYLREPYCEPVLEEWFGWRPMTPDSIPIIGRAPVWKNVFIAAGHNMLGLSMAPATGKLIAEIVSEIPPHLKAEPYSVDRFR